MKGSTALVLRLLLALPSNITFHRSTRTCKCLTPSASAAKLKIKSFANVKADTKGRRILRRERDLQRAMDYLNFQPNDRHHHFSLPMQLTTPQKANPLAKNTTTPAVPSPCSHAFPFTPYLQTAVASTAPVTACAIIKILTAPNSLRYPSATQQMPSVISRAPLAVRNANAPESETEGEEDGGR